MLFSLGQPILLLAQVNVSGKPGLLYIPTASIRDEGKMHFGVTYCPIDYAFRFKGKNSENIYFINLTLLPRLDININLLRPNGEIRFADRGIGDRQFDVKYTILTEKKKRPALALILSAPFGIDNSLITNALVATKTIQLTKTIDAEVTVGTGTPYHIAREDIKNDENSGIFSGFMITNDPKRYLTGPFGGVNIRVNKKAGFMAEWDSHHLNLGAWGILFKHWTVQGGVLNFDQVTLGTSYAFSLFKLPKRVSGHI
ncbi:hypothetical protein GCM10028810_08140 [Spirosoma litoris]